MAMANIKIPSEELQQIKIYTGEKTGQKAVSKAILYYLKAARRRRITEVLQSVTFKKGFDPLKLRQHER